MPRSPLPPSPRLPTAVSPTPAPTTRCCSASPAPAAQAKPRHPVLSEQTPSFLLGQRRGPAVAWFQSGAGISPKSRAMADLTARTAGPGPGAGRLPRAPAAGPRGADGGGGGGPGVRPSSSPDVSLCLSAVLCAQARFSPATRDPGKLLNLSPRLSSTEGWRCCGAREGRRGGAPDPWDRDFQEEGLSEGGRGLGAGRGAGRWWAPLWLEGVLCSGACTFQMLEVPPERNSDSDEY